MASANGQSMPDGVIIHTARTSRQWLTDTFGYKNIILETGLIRLPHSPMFESFRFLALRMFQRLRLCEEWNNTLCLVMYTDSGMMMRDVHESATIGTITMYRLFRQCKIKAKYTP